MALTASTNTTASTALRYLDRNNAAASSSLSKLSSGSRIVKASDDAASLAVGTKIKADVTALKQAQVNAGQAMSLLQVADGGLSQVSDILMRMKALSVQAQSGSVTNTERGFLDKEFQALANQIDDIATQTKFNGSKLLDGSYNASVATAGLTNAAVDTEVAVAIGNDVTAGTYRIAGDGTGNITLSNTTEGTSQTVTVASVAAFNGKVSFDQFDVTLDLTGFATNAALTAGADTEFTVTSTAMSFQVGVASTDTIAVDLADVQTSNMGGAGINDHTGAAGTRTLADAGAGAAASIATSNEAVTAGNILDHAISQINSARADVGAKISRFEFAAANVATSVENLDAARSTLLDVDMAAEMSNFASKQVMTQASVAMLAQANQMPQQLLRLLN